MRYGDEKIYEALHSGLNEYNEIVHQRFSTSDNHDEVRSNLMDLNELGLNPILTFTDNPTKDKNMLIGCFPNLRRSEENMLNDDRSSSMELQKIQARGGIMYLHQIENTIAAMDEFITDLQTMIEGGNETLISFDAGMYIHILV